jgi:hypothetical protein
MKLAKPKKRYYLGKIKYGTPYFYPIGFNKNIITIKKFKASITEKELKKQVPVRRCKHWVIRIFNKTYYIEIGSPIKIHRNGIGWKDKFGTPRFEWCPSFKIFFFKWQFCIIWTAPDNENDDYYEMKLWIENYNNSDIEKAKKTWPWVNMETKKSTWNEKYIIK